MTIIIRKAIAEDISTLTRLLYDLFSIEKDFTFQEEKQKAGLQMLMDCETAEIMVAEYNNEVIGMSTGQLVISTAQGGPSLLVEDVIVSGNVRGKGVGKRLVDAICDWSLAFGCNRFQLLADADNKKAIQFYDKIGWKQTNLICLRKTHSK